MKWLRNLWGTCIYRGPTRAANKVWNEGLWEWHELKHTNVRWINPGAFGEAERSRLDHPAAHKVLGRHAIVDAWMPTLRQKAINTMENKAHIVDMWARIDHPPFWAELTRLFNEEEAKESSRETPFTAAWRAPWLRMLNGAGQCGNLGPFLGAPKHELVRYLSEMEGPPHPKIGLWLVQEGLYTMEQLRGGISPKTYPLEPKFQSFGGNVPGEPIAPEFATQWCALQLEHYGLSLEQKVNLVGHMLIHLGPDAWLEHIGPACAPYIRDINMPLLFSACGIHVPGMHNPDDLLNKTVRLLSQASLPKYNHASVDLSSTPRYGQVDQSLLVMLNLAPPQNRAELYFLACQVDTARHAMAEGMASIDLPALD